MSDNMMQVKNDNGGIVSMVGQLPDGTFGLIIDEAVPFTEEELTDVSKFTEHMDNLAHRVDVSMKSHREFDSNEVYLCPVCKHEHKRIKECE